MQKMSGGLKRVCVGRVFDKGGVKMKKTGLGKAWWWNMYHLGCSTVQREGQRFKC